MNIVRMIEVATRLCDALRGVMLELDAAGIFNDETWKRITDPDPDALPSPLHRLHRRRRAKLRMHGNTELLSGRIESMKSRLSLKFLRRVDRFEIWINELGRTPEVCGWPDLFPTCHSDPPFIGRAVSPRRAAPVTIDDIFEAARLDALDADGIEWRKLCEIYREIDAPEITHDNARAIDAAARQMRELGIADGAELRRIMWRRLSDRSIRLKEIALTVCDGFHS